MGEYALVFGQNLRQLIKGYNEYSDLNYLIKQMLFKANTHTQKNSLFLFLHLSFSFKLYLKVATEDFYTEIIMA